MSPTKQDSAYCPSCGKTVKIFGLMAEGNLIYRCMQCGIEVDVKTDSRGDLIENNSHQPQNEPQPAEPKPLGGFAKGKPSPQKAHKSLKYVMMAEDSKLLAQLVKDLLLEEGFAQKVDSSLDGDTFIQKFTESMIKNTPPNLIILDINLPAIDGQNICVAIRAIEKAFGHTKSRPIIFFTSREIDAPLKRIIDTYPPARYINKGSEGDPEKLAARFKVVMEKLLK